MTSCVFNRETWWIFGLRRCCKGSSSFCFLEFVEMEFSKEEFSLFCESLGFLLFFLTMFYSSFWKIMPWTFRYLLRRYVFSIPPPPEKISNILYEDVLSIYQTSRGNLDIQITWILPSSHWHFGSTRSQENSLKFQPSLSMYRIYYVYIYIHEDWPFM